MLNYGPLATKRDQENRNRPTLKLLASVAPTCSKVGHGLFPIFYMQKWLLSDFRALFKPIFAQLCPPNYKRYKNFKNRVRYYFSTIS